MTTFYTRCSEHEFVSSAGHAWVVAVPRTRPDGAPANATTMVAMARREFRWACMGALFAACVAGAARVMFAGRIATCAVGGTTWLSVSPWVFSDTGVHVRTFER